MEETEMLRIFLTQIVLTYVCVHGINKRVQLLIVYGLLFQKEKKI